MTDVLGQADALIRRHRSFVASPTQRKPADELPVLTEVVDLPPAAGSPDSALLEAQVARGGEGLLP